MVGTGKCLVIALRRRSRILKMHSVGSHLLTSGRDMLKTAKGIKNPDPERKTIDVSLGETDLPKSKILVADLHSRRSY